MKRGSGLSQMSARRRSQLIEDGTYQPGSTFARSTPSERQVSPGAGVRPTASGVLSSSGAFSSCGRHYTAGQAVITAGARNAKGASPQWETVPCWRDPDFHVVRVGSRQAKALKPPAGGEFSPAVKLAVRARAGNGDPDLALCEGCGKWLGRRSGDIQHIVARQSGGSVLVNRICLAALLCSPVTDKATCHGRCEARDREMRAQGFWRFSYDEPSPLMIHGNQGGATLWLTAAGGYSFERPAWAGMAGQTLRELLREAA